MNFHTPPLTYVSHVKINVSDMQAALNFYTGLLGFSILEQNGNEVHLTADGKTSFLSLTVPEHPIEKKKTTGLYHFAILLQNRSELAALLVHLLQNDLEVGAADHNVSEAIYVDDPDGNGIEFYCDRSPDQWTWARNHVVMTTDPLNFEDMATTMAPGQKWEKMPESAIMGHLHLHVSSLAPATNFYTECLGLSVVSHIHGKAVFMSTGKYHHHIAINVWNGTDAPQPEPGSVGLDTFTLSYPDQDALDAAVERLRKMKYEVSTADQMVTSIDPSGNRVIMAVS
ncbi:VOC family protein [Salinicoccus sp. ID82-1]|uniref:VOC family protein n=1 Tax=Salinicoccus cyprini TaxID=2493691 RepID=A0A558AZX9_9STAP|nr:MULTISPECIES: VOC family protein [Salinicoccus]MCG1009423.1 VOC family protein [Salinicoccus sp. ID82-1]TVT29794.1 VOC family protein [Salinicoccus cyprini]